MSKPTITQIELQDLRNAEQLAFEVLQSITRRLRAGATIEAGPLCIRPEAVQHSPFVNPVKD